MSHPCASPVNQQLYAAIEQVTGWNVSLVVPQSWNDEYGQTLQAQRWPQFTGKFIPIPVRRSGNIILHTYRCSFSKLIREENPDVVYVNHEPYAAATAQVYWGNVRAGGQSPRRPIGFYTAQNIAKKYPPPFRWTESWVLRTSRFAFPISETVDRVIRDKGYGGISTVLPLAIDPAVHFPQTDVATTRAQLLGERGTTHPVLLGYLGRLVPEKGLRTLLRATAELGDLPWHLALVGAGPMELELKQLAEELGVTDRVSFSGFVPHTQVSKMLSAFDVLVLPSETQSNWREQFGRVLLEAMACGTPVVGSDSGEIPILINRTGGGLIAREGDSKELANALRCLIVDTPLRSRLAAAGRAAVAKEFTVDSAAKLFARTVEQSMLRDPSATSHIPEAVGV